jgi:hypothetical protein
MTASVDIKFNALVEVAVVTASPKEPLPTV